MKNISFILLAALLVSQTVVQSQVLDIVGPLTKTAFGCLASQGYHVAIVRAYSLNNGGSIDPNAVQTLVNAKSAGFIPFIYINLCRNGDAASQINTVLSSISSSLYRGKWIKVQQNTVAGCQWPTNDPVGNCAFLSSAVQEFSVHSEPVPGIFSTAAAWKSLFGNSCNIFGGIYQLWYADYNSSGQLNSDQNKLDFVPFGGWTYPVYKLIRGNVHVTPLCNNPTWHVFIDVTTFV